MIESTIQTVINIIAGAVISYIFALYHTKKKENDALKAGLQAFGYLPLHLSYCSTEKWRTMLL